MHHNSKPINNNQLYYICIEIILYLPGELEN